MRSGTKASTRNSARPIGGASGSARTSTTQVPAAAPGDSVTGRWSEASAIRGWHGLQEHLPVRPFHAHPRRDVGRLARFIAQQRHHLHRLARPVDAAIQPDERIERTGMRLA